MLLFLLGVFVGGFPSCRFFCYAGFIAKTKRIKVSYGISYLVPCFTRVMDLLLGVCFTSQILHSILLVFVVHVYFLNPRANKIISLSLRTIAASSYKLWLRVLEWIVVSSGGILRCLVCDFMILVKIFYLRFYNF